MKKGDRIETVAPYKGEIWVGHVYSILKDGRVKMIRDGGEKILTMHASQFKPSTQPAPKAKFSLGDRVEFDGKGGKTIYGVVTRVRPDAISVDCDDGETISRGPEKFYRHSDAPRLILTAPPTGGELDPMSNYSVTKFRGIRNRGHEGDGYDATIAKDGVPILTAHDYGDGASVMTYTLKGVPQSEDREFHAAAKEWARFYGDTGQLHCSTELWIGWYRNERTRGITARKYWEDLLADMAQYRGE